MEIITDPHDERLGDFRHLNDPAARRDIEEAGHGLFIVEGLLALDQLLASDHRVRSLLITPNRLTRLSHQIESLRAAGAEILVADRSVLRQAAGFDVHRGVLASVDRPPQQSLDTLLSAAQRVVVLEGVNDHENLGSIFRNCAALGIDAVILDGTTADPLYRRSIRVSLGWATRLPYARYESTDAAISSMRANGFRPIALTPATEALDVDEAAARGLLDDRVALFVGAEGPGLQDTTIEMCDAKVRIPMHPGVDSLNVATSLAVVAAFAAARRGWA
ncbi:MAG: RNA methyltransferase [Microthrixaceae bacterium]